jgi:hypothetical protein
LESLDRARLIDQINVLTSESYGINLCHCSNEKVTSFMFAFKGPIFLEGMMHNKIEEMQFGVLRDDVKYCVVRLFQRNIRCAKHLSNLVHAYNRTLDQAYHIIPVAVENSIGGFFPLFIPESARLTNPIATKHAADKASNDPAFKVRRHIRQY